MSFRDIFPLSDPTRQAELMEALRQLKEKTKHASTPHGPKPQSLSPTKKSRWRRLAEEAAKKAR